MERDEEEEEARRALRSQETAFSEALEACFLVCCFGWLVWSGLVWRGLAWSGLVWHTLAWPGMPWHGLAWPGMVCLPVSYQHYVICMELGERATARSHCVALSNDNVGNGSEHPAVATLVAAVPVSAGTS
ncbi:hypothetical protein V1478_014286 [Vespula squamosa]|uniref:Uncharacterized protein n=1 Tax=Vespula squamosa TaxID=30214 RepID=A0ABD2A7Q2_VESSQ